MTPSELLILANGVLALIDNLAARDGEGQLSQQYIELRTLARRAAVEAARAEGTKGATPGA